MYVYYKDKNDTIGFIDIKFFRSYIFEQPVFIFHTLKTKIDLEIEKELQENEKQAGREDVVFKLLGLNPYELAYVSGGLDYEFEIQDHMFGSSKRSILYNKI